MEIPQSHYVLRLINIIANNRTYNKYFGDFCEVNTLQKIYCNFHIRIFDHKLLYYTIILSHISKCFV